MADDRYQVGGALRPGAIYITRAADQEAEQALAAGDAIHVLGPRQLGKSSLRLRLASRLSARGLRVAHLDLTGLGAPRDLDGWLGAIAEEIALELDDRVVLSEADAGGAARRLARGLLATSRQAPWVLFVDELDVLVALPAVADAFLGALRATWDATAGAAGERPFRLCLAGVVAPFELGLDARRTPFNVSRPVQLGDFTATEAAPLAARFPPAEREALLAEILRWTEGQPYLTHRLAERAAAGEGSGDPGARISGLVHRLFLDGGAHGDANLAAAARGLEAGGEELPEMLALYRRALEPGGAEADGRRSATVRLLLSGLVAWRATPAGPRLRVRNPIYAAVFDGAWVEERLDRRPFSVAFQGWMAAERAEDWLLRGEVLAAARRWADRRADLSKDEVSFLLRSAEAWQAEEARRAELEQRRLGEALQVEQRARARLRLIGLSVFAAAATLVAVGLGLLALRLRSAERETDLQADRAVQAATVAEQASADLLLQQARAALALPDLALAELSAVASLGLFESAGARGVLMSVGARERPQLAWSVQVRGGFRNTRLVAGAGLVLAPDGEDLVVLDGRAGAVRWRAEAASAAGRALSPDGRSLYVQPGRGQPLVEVDLGTGKVARRLGDPAETVVDVVVGPDGRTLVTQTSEYREVALRASDGATLWTRPSPSRRICRAAPSPAGDLVAVGCTGGDLEMLDLGSGRLVARNDRRASGGYALTWLSGGGLVYGGRGEGTDGALHLWKKAGFGEFPTATSLLAWGVARWPRPAGLEVDSLARGGDTALVGLVDGTVAALDAELGSFFARFSVGPALARVAADGRRFYTLSADQVLRAWDLPERPARIAQPLAGDGPLTVFSADDAGLLLADGQGELQLRDPQSGALVAQEGLAPTSVFTHGARYAGAIYGVAGGELSRRDLAGWTRLGRVGTGSMGISVGRGPEGALAVLGLVAPSLLLRRDGRLLEIPCGAGRDAVAARVDGRRLAIGCATAGGAEPVVVLDADGRRIAEIALEGVPAMALAWSGETLLIGRATGEILAWTEGARPRPWARMEGAVVNLESAADGGWIAGCDTLGVVTVWDASGAPRATLGPLSPQPARLQIAEGRMLARLGDGGIVAWPLAPLDQTASELQDEAARRWGASISGGQLTWSPAPRLPEGPSLSAQ